VLNPKATNYNQDGELKGKFKLLSGGRSKDLTEIITYIELTKPL